MNNKRIAVIKCSCCGNRAFWYKISRISPYALTIEYFCTKHVTRECKHIYVAGRDTCNYFVEDRLIVATI
jgi:hypothetical protein